MSVKCKFKCNSVEQSETTQKVNLSAVYSDKGENADFTQYTPWGELQVLITNEAPAANQFKPGKSYYLMLEEAPE